MPARRRGVKVVPGHPTYAAIMRDVMETWARMPVWFQPSVTDFCLEVTSRWLDEVGVRGVWEEVSGRAALAGSGGGGRGRGRALLRARRGVSGHSLRWG